MTTLGFFSPEMIWINWFTINQVLPFFPPIWFWIFIFFIHLRSPPFPPPLSLAILELGASADTLSYVSPASDSAAAAQPSWTGAHQAHFPHVPGRTALRSGGTAAVRPGAQRCEERSWLKGVEQLWIIQCFLAAQGDNQQRESSSNLPPSPVFSPLCSVNEKEKGSGKERFASSFSFHCNWLVEEIRGRNQRRKSAGWEKEKA